MLATRGCVIFHILALGINAIDMCDDSYIALNPSQSAIRSVGDSIEFFCNCDMGTGQVSWYKTGSYLARGTSDIYRVSVASETDGGYYSCRCDSSMLLNNCFRLAVRNVITHCAAVPSYVPVGGNVTFYCAAAGYPKPLNCEVAGPGLSKPVVLPINETASWSNLQQENGGTYTCIVNHNVSGYDTEQTVILVYGRPRINLFEYVYVRDTNSVHLTCIVENAFSVSYELNGTTLPGNESTKYLVQINLNQLNGSAAQYVLIIANVSSEDAGEYTCQVGSQYNQNEQREVVRLTPSQFLVPTSITSTPVTRSTVTATLPTADSAVTTIVIIVSTCISPFILLIVIILVFCACCMVRKNRRERSGTKVVESGQNPALEMGPIPPSVATETDTPTQCKA